VSERELLARLGDGTRDALASALRELLLATGPVG